MASSDLLVHSNEAPGRATMLVAAGVIALLALYMLNGGSYLPALAIFYVIESALFGTRASANPGA